MLLLLLCLRSIKRKLKVVVRLNSDSKWKGQRLCLAILQSFLAFFCQLLKYILQNLGADGHFEGLNMSEFQLDQNLWHQWQIVLTSVCFNFGRKKIKVQVPKIAILQPLLVILLTTNNYLSQNWDSQSHFEVLFMKKYLLDQQLQHSID